MRMLWKILAVCTCVGVAAVVAHDAWVQRQDDAKLPLGHAQPLGREVRSLRFPDDVRDIVWSHNGRYIAASNGMRNRVYLYDLDRGKIRWTIAKMPSREGLAFTRDDVFVVTGVINGADQSPDSREHTLGLISVETGKPLNLRESKPEGDINYLRSFALTKDGRHLIGLFGNWGRILVYDTTDWKVVRRLGPVNTAVYKAVGSGLIAVDAERDLFVFGYGLGGKAATWKLSTNTKLNEFKTFDRGMETIAINPATGWMVAGNTAWGTVGKSPPFDKMVHEAVFDDPATGVRAWNPETGQAVVTYPGVGLGSNALAVSPDGRFLAALRGGGLNPGYLLAWDAMSGRLLAGVGLGTGNLLEGLAFGPDGRRLAYSKNHYVHILELDPILFR